MGQCYKTFYRGNLVPFYSNYQGKKVSSPTQNDSITMEWQYTIAVKCFITLAPGGMYEYQFQSNDVTDKAK